MITREEAREKYAIGTPKQVCDSVADLIETYPEQHDQALGLAVMGAALQPA